MALVKVWNDNVYVHKERFKNEMVEIAPGGYVEMEYEDGIDFKGQFTGIAPIGPDGKPDARYFKKIRVERPAVYGTDTGLVCHADGTKAESVEELKAKLALYKDRLAKDDEADRAVGADSELKALVQKQQEQIAFLMEQLQPKKGPGRPRKEA